MKIYITTINKFKLAEVFFKKVALLANCHKRNLKIWSSNKI